MRFAQNVHYNDVHNRSMKVIIMRPKISFNNILLNTSCYREKQDPSIRIHQLGSCIFLFLFIPATD